MVLTYVLRQVHIGYVFYRMRCNEVHAEPFQQIGVKLRRLGCKDKQSIKHHNTNPKGERKA